ncbi:Zn-dependent hydrolase [Komagataeibacter xylinus]|nr:amidase, hydantoinase/carbamoylase family [Komagataeibacter xylinus E25]RFP03917.1 Zn-dependent hydrolase [Komagataeibacter xylinus]
MVTSLLSSHIQPERLWADLMELGAITDPDRPYTRRSFSDRFLEGRAWLRTRLEQAGLTCRIDTAGNLIGRRPATSPTARTIMTGSHSDTVPAGGRFDGILGVLAGVEIARAMQDSGAILSHHFEVIDFLAEEPSDFGLSCIGSRGMTDSLTADHLALLAPWGENLADAITRMGGNAAELPRAQRHDIAAFMELHIEQGIVLERTGTDIGIVDGIVGVTRIEVIFAGRADHAGTTPMDCRQDALVVAAGMVTAVSRLAREAAGAKEGHVTATCGVMEVQPNASNVVPRQARLVIDIRVSERETRERLVTRFHAVAAELAAEAHVMLAGFEIQSDTSPVACSSVLAGELEAAAHTLGLSSRRMVSGAGHDAAFMARIAPSAMLFIPCRDGRSHDPDEWITAHDAANGTRVLADAIMTADRMS